MTSKASKIIKVNPAFAKKQKQLDETMNKTMDVIRNASDKLNKASKKS